MTEVVFGKMMEAPSSGFDGMNPANISPLVVWLGSSKSREVTGRVFEVRGGEICVYQGWRPGPTANKGARWDPTELGTVVDNLLSRAITPMKVYGA
jgi:hypothetical protein